MSPQQAKMIVESLANGIDPDTGEILSDKGLLNNPEVTRALFVASKALDQMAKRKARQTSLPENVGQSWSEAEEKELLVEFDGGLPVTDIAAKHGRTKGAITSRLARFGRISSPMESKPSA